MRPHTLAEAQAAYEAADRLYYDTTHSPVRKALLAAASATLPPDWNGFKDPPPDTPEAVAAQNRLDAYQADVLCPARRARQWAKARLKIFERREALQIWRQRSSRENITT